MESTFEKAARVSCEVVARSAGVDLRPRSGKLYALCPLHAEGTPSFTIDTKKNAWYCFGCNRGGGVIALYSALTGLRTLDAALALAGDEKPVERRLRRPEEVWLELAPELASIWRRLFVLSDRSDEPSKERMRADVRSLAEYRRRYKLASAREPYTRKISLDNLGEALLDVSDNGVRQMLFALSGSDLWRERLDELRKETL